MISDTLLSQNYGIFSEYTSALLPEKLKHGKGIWELWIGMNGTTAFEANSGVLIEVDAPVHNKKGKSITAGLKEMIAAHKAGLQHK